MANSIDVTEDGRPYVKGRKYWFVNICDHPIYKMPMQWYPYMMWQNRIFSTMSTKHKVFESIIEANKYIIKNKPENVPYYADDF